MSEKQKPHVDQLEEDDEFEEFDQVRVLLQGLRVRIHFQRLRIRNQHLKNLARSCKKISSYLRFFVSFKLSKVSVFVRKGKKI
jgi:hypothetical protein